jgi:hypothetical protein
MLKSLFLIRLYFACLWVCIPKIAYKGQKPTKLVSMKIAATASRTTAHQPDKTCVKYSTPMAMAVKILITLSKPPMFVLILSSP